MIPSVVLMLYYLQADHRHRGAVHGHSCGLSHGQVGGQEKVGEVVVFMSQEKVEEVVVIMNIVKNRG